MKKIIPLFLLLYLSLYSIYSQSSVCETKNESSIDQNTISINKCEIIEKVSKPISKKRTNIVRKRVLRKSSNHLNINGNNISLKLTNKKDKIKLPNSTKEVLFDLVEETPMFESCPNSTKKENIKCFKAKINKHFSKNFKIENFIDETFNEKIFIKFSIDIYGKVINQEIRSRDKLITKELQRVLQKLPVFNAGKVKGIPVIVTYSFPLNLTLN